MKEQVHQYAQLRAFGAIEHGPVLRLTDQGQIDRVEFRLAVQNGSRTVFDVVAEGDLARHIAPQVRRRRLALVTGHVSAGLNAGAPCLILAADQMRVFEPLPSSSKTRTRGRA